MMSYETARATADDMNRIYKMPSQYQTKVLPAGWHKGWLLWWNLGVPLWQIDHNDFHETLRKDGLSMEKEMKETLKMIKSIKKNPDIRRYNEFP